jgi:hypothetical protein
MAFMRFKPLEQSMNIEQTETTTTPETSPENTEAAGDATPDNTIEGQEENKDTEHKPKHGGLQKRIDKLTRDKYELLGKYKALEERVSRGEARPAARPEGEDGEEDPKEIIRAEARRMAQELLAEERAKSQRTETAKSWRQQEADAIKRFPDYKEVVEEFVESGLPQHMEAAILRSGKGPEVTYHLATHPEVAAAIADMDPFSAAVAIGEIKARLGTAPALRTKSAATEPISPVKPKGKPDEGLSDELSAEDWAKRRNAQLRNKNTSQQWKKA